MMNQTVRHHTILLAVAGTVLFAQLGTPRLWDRDEPRNARCAAEMIETGDWVVPVFNGELRTHKPILLYWLMMTAYGVLGVNEFAARFWSAALGLGTVLTTYHLGRRLFCPQAGLWAALALSTSLMFDVAARAATPDSVLIFFSTATLAVFAVGFIAPPGSAEAEQPLTRYSPLNWWTAAAMYALMGAAILAKGPVGMVLPMAVIGLFLLIVWLPENSLVNIDDSWWRRALRSVGMTFAPAHFLRTLWSMRPVTGLAVALTVALPWYVWVGARTDGEWLRGFFLEHNLHRATGAMEGHSGSILYYPVAVLVGFFPWSLFMAPLGIEWARGVRGRDRWRPGFLFAACWVGVYVGLFSLAQTKLPSYVTPMYPALAMLAGAYFHRWTRWSQNSAAWWPLVSFVILGLVGLAMLAGLPIAARRFLPGEEWLGLLGLVPLAGAVTAILLASRKRDATAGVFATTAVAFSLAVFAVIQVRIDRHQQFDRLLSTANSIHAHPHLASYACHEPSWVFYARQKIPLLMDSADSAVKPGRDAVEFLDHQPDALLITTANDFQRIRPQLSPEVAVLDRVPYFLKKSELVLLGRPALHTAQREDVPPASR